VILAITLVGVIILLLIFVPIGMGTHVCRSLVQTLVRRRPGLRLVLQLSMVRHCLMVAALTAAGATVEPMSGDALQGQGRHAAVSLLARLARVYRVVLRVRLGMAVHV
jgi:hypothetical protein